jgi:UDP-N-acetylmuramate dehydrogenase
LVYWLEAALDLRKALWSNAAQLLFLYLRRHFKTRSVLRRASAALDGNARIRYAGASYRRPVQIQLEVKTDHPLATYTTFAIGGPADRFVVVKSIDDLKEALAYGRENQLPIHVLGKGSNTLFDEAGFRGLVILNKIGFIEDLGEGRFHVGAGYSFALLGVRTARSGWSGLEFASGIPCSVGGAIVMNAGANGQETEAVIESVTHLDDDLTTYQRSELVFSYRTSPFQKMGGAVVAATFQLTPFDGARARQLEIINYRMSTQPYGQPSAGCVFRNSDGEAAGALIEECGLKGTRVGDAEISTLHGNFIVNTGNATAHDVLALADQIRETVTQRTGITLEQEIRYVPPEEK